MTDIIHFALIDRSQPMRYIARQQCSEQLEAMGFMSAIILSILVAGSRMKR